MTFGFGPASQKDHAFWQQAVPLVKEKGIMKQEHVEGFRTTSSKEVATRVLSAIKKNTDEFKKAFEGAVQAKIRNGSVSSGRSLEETVFEVLKDVLARTYTQAPYNGTKLKHKGRDLFTTKRGISKAEEVAFEVTDSLFSNFPLSRKWKKQLTSDLKTILTTHNIVVNDSIHKSLTDIRKRVEESVKRVKQERDTIREVRVNRATGEALKKDGKLKKSDKWQSQWSIFAGMTTPCYEMLDNLTSEKRSAHSVKAISTHPEDQATDQAQSAEEETSTAPIVHKYLDAISKNASVNKGALDALRFARSQIMKEEIQAGSKPLAFSSNWIGLEKTLIDIADSLCLRVRTQEVLNVVKDLAQDVSGQEVDAVVAFEKGLKEVFNESEKEINKELLDLDNAYKEYKESVEYKSISEEERKNIDLKFIQARKELEESAAEKKQRVSKLEEDPKSLAELKGGSQLVDSLKQDAPKLIKVVTAIRNRLSKFPHIDLPTSEQVDQEVQNYDSLPKESKDRGKKGEELGRVYFLNSLSNVKNGLEFRANHLAKYLESHGFSLPSPVSSIQGEAQEETMGIPHTPQEAVAPGIETRSAILARLAASRARKKENPPPPSR